MGTFVLRPKTILSLSARCVGSLKRDQNMDMKHEQHNSDLEEYEVGLESHQYKLIFSDAFDKKWQSRPNKRGIVRVKSCGVQPDRCLYLAYRGANQFGVNKETALIHPRTMDRLGFKREEGGRIEVSPAWPVVGRFAHYWQHPDSATRISFKLGGLGLLIGLASLIKTIWP